MKAQRFIHIALPATDELEYLPSTIECLLQQNYDCYSISVLINQPEAWWEDNIKSAICFRNVQTAEWLLSLKNKRIKIIDRFSRGKGWKGKEAGVGIARKTVMDSIAETANANDLILSMDADTIFGRNYLAAVSEAFAGDVKYAGLSVPYYHKLTNNELIDRAILRYEIYMRYYSLNLWRINSPYNFTALGSAIAVPVWAYKAVGGMTPKKGGEDFYFLQKLRKYGEISNYLPEKVYPATRYSDRVDFGTGPALIKGAAGNWDSYPVYDYKLFDDIYETYKLFPNLHKQDIKTPMSEFLENISGNEQMWGKLRKNNPDEIRFIKACHEKVNALRILQYLKNKQNQTNRRDEENLKSFTSKFFGNDETLPKVHLSSLDFNRTDIQGLNTIRDYLAEKEEYLQRGIISAVDGTFINN